VVELRHELGDPDRVGGMDRLQDEVSAREVAEEPHFSLPPEPGAEEVGDLDDHKRRHYEGLGRSVSSRCELAAAASPGGRGLNRRRPLGGGLRGGWG
jgi:hypothetical protein